MKTRFLKIAQQELDAAVEYYNHERRGLGNEFLWELLSAIDRIAEYPSAWQKFLHGTRRCLLRRFPFGIIYAADENIILVIAVAHLHREPDYWIERLKK